MRKQSEIRESQVRDLLEKVRKRNYGSYLRSLFLKRVRHLQGATITFDFPVTALVGPNGSGKSTVLATAGCAYGTSNSRDFFFTSIVGDRQDFSWDFEYELIDRQLASEDAIRGTVSITKDAVIRSPSASRPIKYFQVHRTLPPVTSPQFMRKHLAGRGNSIRSHQEVDIEFVRCEASRVLAKELSSFKLLDVAFTRLKKVRATKLRDPHHHEVQDSSGPKYKKVPVQTHQHLFVFDGEQAFSEFNFGAGEASVLRLILGVESLPEQALILIEEIENGLHPLAVERLVEYLIAAASRRKIQVIFTTHSDYALNPLPAEAVWAVLGGKLAQGRLSVESMRALSGQIEKRLAIFTEDYFAQRWVEAVLREGLGGRFDEIGVYHLGGDGAAVGVHLAHNQDPSASFKSLCFIDGDSKQVESTERGIFRLPGESPELEIFNKVKANLQNNAAILTAGCQRSLSSQQLVVDAVNEIANTNRDPHLLFAQVGARIGLVSEEIVRGAFFSVWIQENPAEVKRISELVLITGN